MPFMFNNISPTIRQHIVNEINSASTNGNFYMSTRFNQNGINAAVGLLTQAAQSHDEHWLAYQIESLSLMRDYEVRTRSFSGYTIAHIPHSAAETYAEGQFNRFYMIATCVEAIASGRQVRVYRAKQVMNNRASSNNLIGSVCNPNVLINELRTLQTSLGHNLLMPNSGLSIEII